MVNRNHNLISDVMKYINSLSHERNFKVTSQMTTNGALLTARKHKELKDLGVTSFQVSFDGDAPFHNKLRVTRNNTPTFDLVYNNLLALHKSDIENNITVRIHINNENAESVEHLLERFKIDIGSDERFQFFIRSLERLGSSNDGIIPVLDDHDVLERIVTNMNQKAIELDLNLYKEKNESYVCYASLFNSFVIRSNGEIGKCTVALNDKKNTIGKIREDGKISLTMEKFKYWIRGQMSKNEEELGCPYFNTPDRNS